ncbi:carbohydrate-binding protein [Paraglaciecola sp. L1A13]|uniref:carbohydrate-binding protein n=1 Tax=Paraglaciecola sp. L1A13 TaxID=2686359 RepID=UPI00131D0D50|nr:carbohydrate-binding protein [Paraglaciecola sp. L1A13]
MNFNIRKTSLYLALTTALSMACALSAHAESVSIDNSGFEDGFDGWNDDDPSAISSNSYSGSKSAKITGSGGRVEQTVSLTANTDYILTAYVEGSGEIGINLGTSTESTKSTSDDWNKVTVSFNSGTTTSGAMFGKYYNDEGRFDDFTLISTGETEPGTGSGSETSIPGLIQAEDYDNYYDTTSANKGGQYTTDSVDVQTTADTGGGYNVGWIVADEWLEYNIDIPSTASYTLDARVASPRTTGSFIVQVDGSQVGDEIDVGNTGGWQSWATKSIDLGQLSAGSSTLKILVTGSNFNINWLEIYETEDGTIDTAYGNECEETGRILYNASCEEYSEVYEAESGELGEEDHIISLSPIEMTFDALAAQHVTENGNGWRHELKIKSNGEYRVGMTEVYEEFKATITATLDDGAKTIVAQHHAADTATITKLYIADLDEGGFENAPDGTESDSVAMNGVFDVYIRLADPDSDGETKHLLTTIRSGESFEFEEINDHGVVTVTINGMSLDPISVDDSSESYFKFGNYQQAQNPETGEKLVSGDADDDYADFYAEYFDTSEITFTKMSYTRTLD